MIITIFSLFIIYTTLCCIDGPDIANGNITEWSKKKSCKKLLSLAKTIHEDTFVRMTIPRIPPQHYFPEVYRLDYEHAQFDTCYEISYPEIMQTAERIHDPVADSNQFFMVLMNNLVEHCISDFARKIANEIVTQKCFDVELLPGRGMNHALFLKITFILTRPNHKDTFGTVNEFRLPCCNLRFDTINCSLEELKDYVFQCGPYIPNDVIKRFSRSRI